MDEADKEQDHSETLLKATDDKKWRWNSFRKGKKQIKKLWKSRKNTKQVEGEQTGQGDSGESHENIAYDSVSEEFPMSPISTTSSIDPVPSITLHRPSVASEGSNSSPDWMAATTDEDDITKESQNPTGPKSPAQGSLSLILSNHQESNVCNNLYWVHDHFYLLCSTGFSNQPHFTTQVTVHWVIVSIKFRVKKVTIHCFTCKSVDDPC